MRSAGEL